MEMIKNGTKLILVISLFYGFMTGCTTDNEEDLMPENSCDTLNVAYSTIALIMTDNCVSCHNADFTNRDGTVLDSYSDLKSSINTGLLWPSINHQEGYIPMPSGAPQLAECELNKIGAWINAGMPE